MLGQTSCCAQRQEEVVDALLRRAEDRLDRLCQQVRAKISREMDDATCKLLARAAPGSEFLAAESAPVLNEWPENDADLKTTTPDPPADVNDPQRAQSRRTSTMMKKKDEPGAAHRILGLPSTGSERGAVVESSSWLHAMGLQIVTSARFEFVSMSMIVVYSLVLGLQINYLATTLTDDAGWWDELDVAFGAYFLFEVALKLFVYRLSFFTMHGCFWNLLDLVLCALQLFEEIAMLTLWGGNVGMPQAGAMRTVRLLRSIKVMRLIRAVKFAEELQLLVSCLLLSMQTFMWVLVLLVMTVYVIAIYITQTVYVYRLDNPGNAELADKFGTLWVSMLSVFQSLTGGMDWNDVSDPLIKYISPAFGTVYVVYNAFCYLALMNVITGTFVEAVSEQAEGLKTRSRTLRARQAFRDVDEDESGLINLSELTSSTNAAAMDEFFRSMRVEPTEAKNLLEVLDEDGSGTINFDEFLQGTLRLHSPAREADVVLLGHEMKQLFTSTRKEMKLIRDYLERPAWSA
ncbi:Cacna1h [Symbiodinium natans]|uniref:Cacna1h protein n=1 Tax=Symbiodinium natans TaxID=878477 RepID=A0A812K0H8_9DINO|nr:Cacna1h [Symbiodinium natans]